MFIWWPVGPTSSRNDLARGSGAETERYFMKSTVSATNKARKPACLTGNE